MRLDLLALFLLFVPIYVTASAFENQGVVYDLTEYHIKIGTQRPWTEFNSYHETLDNATISPVNEYVQAVSTFMKKRCPIEYCKHVLIVGDDFVVPMARIRNPTSNGQQVVFTDSVYTSRSTMSVAEKENIFEQRNVAVVIPDNIAPGSNLEKIVAKIKEEIKAQYKINGQIEEYKSSQITCNTNNNHPLRGKTLVLIGTQYNNNAIACERVFDDKLTNYSVRRNVWGDGTLGIKNYAFTLKQESLSEVESPAYRFWQEIKNKQFYKRDLASIANDTTNTVVACIGLKENLNLEETGTSIACNVIPVVELLPDAVDSGRCLLNSEKTIVDEFVCTIIHAASAYDVAGYLAGAVSAGGGALVAEVGDGGIASVKALLKLAVKQLQTSVIKAAEPVFKEAPDLLLAMGEFVAKRGGDAIEATKTFIRMAQHGKAALEKTLEIISKSAIKWSNDAHEGLASLLKTRSLNYYDDVLRSLGDEFAEYYSKAVGKGVANPETIELAKFQEIDNAYKAANIDNMLEQGGTEQLEMIIKNTSSVGGVKIGTKQIAGVTRIIKGRATDTPGDFGWLHIKRKHMDGVWNGVGPNPPTTFLKEYGIKEESVVKNLIDEAIQKGIRNVDEEKLTNYVIDYVPYHGKKTMRVIINKEFGTVTSAYPLEVLS